QLPSPSDILIRPSELPEGFAQVDEPGVASLLPDGLARQAAASFRRDADAPGITYVRQVVLLFDDRDAAEYVSRFSGLMVGHQDIPSQQDAVHWPQPSAQLPGPPSVAVVQARSQRPVGDQALDDLMPRQRNRARPPADLKEYAKSIGPLINQFWNRALSMTN